MIKKVSGNVLESNANFIINLVSSAGTIYNKAFDAYPHVEREFRRYCKHCSKNGKEILGTVQYVPVDEWALILCDTKNNKRVEAYDNKYQYIVNLVCQNTIVANGNSYIDNKAVEKGLKDIKKKAEEINASIAMPIRLNQECIDSIFGETKLDVSLYKKNKGDRRK